MYSIDLQQVKSLQMTG